jgi:hypothetical protein
MFDLNEYILLFTMKLIKIFLLKNNFNLKTNQCYGVVGIQKSGSIDNLVLGNLIRRHLLSSSM